MNRILYADDCLNVLSDEVALPTGSVDLIYLDPPFNSKSNYNLPFKGKYKNLKPVEAFKDTWTWGEQEEEYLEILDSGHTTKALANVIRLSQSITEKSGGGRNQVSTPAYLTNMAIRLIPMRRVLKDTGSIYLHCDPTANNYLRLMLDVVFGHENFRNEIIWGYRKMPNKIQGFQKNHDVIFFYSKSNNYSFNVLRGEMTEGSKRTFESAKRRGYNANNSKKMVTVFDWNKYHDAVAQKKIPADLKPVTFKGGNPPLKDWWEDIKILGGPYNKERLGYPTQKPIALLERIIKASSNEGDLVLDPFCGCGTTVHAAEKLKRNWIGIDISTFSVGLMKERILNKFPNLNSTDISIHGTPYNLTTARKLAKKNPFDFEKWACGEIGAHGMFHNPGDKGADKGVDGVINFARFKGFEQKAQKEFAIVQVKGGKVTSDSVGRLYSTVKKFDATAGIFVCFEKYMKTVENEKVTDKFEDLTGTYPVIQGFSVEQLLNNEKPLLPPLVFRKGAKLKSNTLFLNPT